MEHLMGKIVKITYTKPAPRGSLRDQWGHDTGRIVKFYSDGSKALIVNPECLTEEDIHYSENNDVFQWGMWVDVDEATFEEIAP